MEIIGILIMIFGVWMIFNNKKITLNIEERTLPLNKNEIKEIKENHFFEILFNKNNHTIEENIHSSEYGFSNRKNLYSYKIENGKVFFKTINKKIENDKNNENYFLIKDGIINETEVLKRASENIFAIPQTQINDLKKEVEWKELTISDWIDKILKT